MKLEILMFCFAIHIASCLKKPANESKHVKKQIDMDCKNISCPPDEDPICMRMKNKKTKKAVFVVILNKCEMGYMKCHKDMEGTTVPMKYCDQMHLKSAPDVKNISQIRSKRDTSGVIDDTPVGNEENNNYDGAAYVNPNAADEYVNEDDPQPTSQYISQVINPNGADEYVNEDSPQPTSQYISQVISYNATKDQPSSENEEFSNLDYDDIYRRDCPNVCPTRVRLVCAKCEHGVYKTFLSSCHVRMFNCQQDNEKMKLISRSSCTSSSPLLTTEPEAKINLKPEGQVYDRDDGDPVLAFIRCRNRNSVIVDDNGLEIIDASACKNIGKQLRREAEYDDVK